MDSKIDYNNYKADSLLNDAYFLESEQHPTPESIMFWDKLAQENKQLAKEIAIARNFLHILRHVPKPYLPQQKVDSIWKCISDQNRLEIQNKRKRRILYRTLAAACIVVFLVSGWYLQNIYQTSECMEKSDIVAVKKPDVSTNQTLLILSEKKQIAIQGAGEVFDSINLLTRCENGFILSPTQGRERRQMKHTADARHGLPGRMRCSQTNSRQTD